MWVELVRLTIFLPLGLASDQSLLWFVSEKQFDLRGFRSRIDTNHAYATRVSYKSFIISSF